MRSSNNTHAVAMRIASDGSIMRAITIYISFSFKPNLVISIPTVVGGLEGHYVIAAHILANVRRLIISIKLKITTDGNNLAIIAVVDDLLSLCVGYLEEGLQNAMRIDVIVTFSISSASSSKFTTALFINRLSEELLLLLLRTQGLRRLLIHETTIASSCVLG